MDREGRGDREGNQPENRETDRDGNRPNGDRPEMNRGDREGRQDGNRDFTGSQRLRNYLQGDWRPGQRDARGDRGAREEVEDRTAADRFRDRLRGEENERGDRDRGDQFRDGDRRELGQRQLRQWNDSGQIAARIRGSITQGNQYRGPRFDQDFWRSSIRENQRNQYYHFYGAYNTNRGRNYDRGYWWQPTSADVLTSFVVGNWGRPVYYNYGPGGTVYYRDGYVYMNGDRYVTGPQYYQQAVRICRSAPDYRVEEIEKHEWKPLGVYALTTEESQENPSLIVQLAINKDGVLSGTFYDEETEETHPLRGKVDPDTQRAVWSFADQENSEVVMETAFFNLTKEEATVLVHFGPEVTESWLMVRLPSPNES
ncbi:hypothetical protein [Rubinisphaera margarita]|uniref:hypothetical protein n=1 Tax=Rubinisphaera margarita TaxID=2909586 RepID=UPI001EE8E8A9|nr:hypothetical protein [Rubinisphaera margarita]MCG6158034.1 hypothetical protein [Rubinisphaera margarita]